MVSFKKMYKPFVKPIIKALPDVNIPEPRISMFIFYIVKIFARLYLSLLLGFAKVFLIEEKILFDAFKRALAGKSRCIIAFRHAMGAEPQLLAWFFFTRLKAFAAGKKVRFARRPHVLFIYGYEVVRWGGWTARLFMPNMGAMPIHHTKLDSKGMARIHNALVNGPYPLAAAPEGQVSYFTNSLPHLETGIIRIGFQAAGQLAANNENCPVEILPISIHQRFGRGAKADIEKLLRKIEKICGLSVKTKNKLLLDERLRQCRNYILGINEERYGLSGAGNRNAGNSDAGVAALSFEERLDKVVNAALKTAERMLGIKSEGDFFTRLYRVRHICWDRIYLPGIEKLDEMPFVKRNMMDLGTGEAWYISRHQELADFAWYFRRPVPAVDAELHIQVEYVQNLWDFAGRTMGGAISNRKNIFPKKVFIQAAPVINLSERLTAYREDRKTAVAECAQVLEKEYLDCIKQMDVADKIN